MHGDPTELRPDASAVGLRTVQEALTNALRYAPGADLTIHVDCRDGLPWGSAMAGPALLEPQPSAPGTG
jgi:hypothetical protein